jgi:O-antigen/teichoic acid export membrane protein
VIENSDTARDEGDGLKQAAASGVRHTGVASIAIVVIGLINTAVLGRLLGPEAFGLFAMVMVYMGFAVMLSDMGLPEALIQRKEPTREALASLYWLNVALGVLMYGVSVVSAPWVAAGFGAPELAELIPVGALAIPIGALASQFAVLAKRELRFKLIAAIQVAMALLGLGVALISAVVFDQGVWSFVWGTLASSVLSAGCYLAYGLKSFGFPGFHFAWRDLKGYLSFGTYCLGSNALNYANTNVDQMLIGALFGAQVLGYYRLAINLVFQPINRLNPMITQVAFPVFSKIQDDTRRIRTGFLKIIRVLTLIDSPIFIGVALVAPVAVPLVMEDRWLPAVPLIQVLVFYGLIRAMSSAAGAVIMAKGKADWTFHWNLAVFALVPLTIYLAARTGDVLMVAWALVGLQAVLWVFNYRFILRRLLGSFLFDYLKAFGPPALSALGMGVCVLGVRTLLPDGVSLLNLGVQVATGVVAYSVLIWIFMRTDVNETLRLALGRR